MRLFACVVRVAPAGMVPVAPPPLAAGLLPAPGLVVCVFPLAVVTGRGAAGRLAAAFTGPLCAGRFVVRGGVLVAGRVVGCGLLVVGAGAAAPTGTSFNCGCAALSRFASARSRFSVESLLRAVLSTFAESALHAANSEVATSNDAPA